MAEPVDICEVDITIDGNLCHLWQYDNALHLNSILQGEQAFYRGEITVFLENWRKYVFDIRTAGSVRRADGTFDTYGLDLWAEILGVPLPEFSNTSDPEILDTYRRFLLARAFVLNSNGSMAAFNEYLRYFFAKKPIVVYNNYDMSITVLAFWEMSVYDRALFETPEFIPLPVGVRVNIIDGANPEDIFGYRYSEMGNFDNAPFVNFVSRQ